MEIAMWLRTGTTAALARARNDNEALTSIRQGAPEAVDPTAEVAGPLEALAAVIPTGIAVFYTAAVLVIRGVALDEGASDRVQATARMGAKGDSAAVITAALESMPLETTAFVAARWFLLGFSLLTVAVMTFACARAGAAQATRSRMWVAAEPLTAVIAFAGWSLASPGTPEGRPVHRPRCEGGWRGGRTDSGGVAQMEAQVVAPSRGCPPATTLGVAAGRRPSVLSGYSRLSRTRTSSAPVALDRFTGRAHHRKAPGPEQER